ncbi:MAG: hypothetical protein ACRBEQ_05540 [Hyphomonas sp.]
MGLSFKQTNALASSVNCAQSTNMASVAPRTLLHVMSRRDPPCLVIKAEASHARNADEWTQPSTGKSFQQFFAA